MKTAQPATEPFVKWAGGKRQLLSRLTIRMPAAYNRYFEPFVGGAALFFFMQPKDALINDINKELIHVYLCIKKQVDGLMRELDKIDDAQSEPYKEYYYKIREKYNQKTLNQIFDIEMAALFIYLNKHCFNGLYRVNRKGAFNVPFNNRHGPSYNKSNLLAVSEALQSVDIRSGDFETACKSADKEDFIFFDSPYAPLCPTSFESYTKYGFSIEEHERLAKLFKRLDAKGCYCMLTNHNTDFIRSLYKGFSIEEVDVKRLINSDATNRVGKEIIIRNYD